MSVRERRKATISRPENPDLYADTTPSQRETIRRAASRQRWSARCVASGFRCRTDGDAYLGTWTTHEDAIDAAEVHDHEARARSERATYVVVCLSDGCEFTAIEDSPGAARNAWWGHNHGHDPVWDLSDRLVDALEFGGEPA